MLGAAGSGGSTAASGGSAAANGGSTAASGGSTAASGGSTAANGGSTAANGGSTAANGGANSAGGAGGASGFPDPSSFVCNAMLGVSVTGDWFGAGFETGLNGDRWQLKWRSLGFVEQWADPANDIWAVPWISACTNGSNNPDRVIFTGVNWSYKTEAQWETALTSVVETLKGKYSALKEIDLMTMLRAPGNMLCPGATTPEQVVAPYIDQAVAAVVAKYPKLVRAVPPLYAPNCDVFLPNSPHFATGKAAVVAQVIRDYYLTH